jgi:hypothetical protein
MKAIEDRRFGRKVVGNVTVITLVMMKKNVLIGLISFISTTFTPHTQYVYNCSRMETIILSCPY